MVPLFWFYEDKERPLSTGQSDEVLYIPNGKRTEHPKTVYKETCEIIFTSYGRVAQRQTLFPTLHFNFYIYKALWKCIIHFTVLLSMVDMWCCIEPVLPLGYKPSEALTCMFGKLWLL